MFPDRCVSRPAPGRYGEGMTDGRDVQRERARVLKKLKALSDSYQASTLPLLLDSLLTTDLTIQQLKVLAVLATTEDGATGRGLADSFGVSLASMSGLIDRLVAQGAAARNRDGKDGRVRRVHATLWAVRWSAALSPTRRNLVRRCLPGCRWRTCRRWSGG